MTWGLLSQVTLPCALKHHEALCCPALAILVPVMPRDQPNGAKLREPPASKRLHEPTRTSARPVPQLCPKRASTTHHYPPSEPAREPGQPRTEAGRRAGPASYYYYSCWPIWRTFFFCATNRRNPSASEVCMYVINGIVSLRICVYVLHIHTHIYIYICMYYMV